MSMDWIKLLTNMFEDRKVLAIRNMPEIGRSLTLIWIHLLLEAGKTNDGGWIYLTKNRGYSVHELAKNFDEPVQNVEIALRALQGFEMIEVDEYNRIYIANWFKHQSVEALEDRQARDRERKALWRQAKDVEEKLAAQGYSRKQLIALLKKNKGKGKGYEYDYDVVQTWHTRLFSTDASLLPANFASNDVDLMHIDVASMHIDVHQNSEKLHHDAHQNEKFDANETQAGQGIDGNIIDVTGHVPSTSRDVPRVERELELEKEILQPYEQRPAKTAQIGARCADSFEKFWNLYPNKKGRAKAWAKWQMFHKAGSIDIDAVLVGTETYIQYIDWQRKNRKDFSESFVKHGDTFVNQRSWEDDWSIPKTATGNRRSREVTADDPDPHGIGEMLKREYEKRGNRESN